jgi:hypothetical protein
MTNAIVWDVVAPLGREPVAELCEALFGRLDLVTGRVNAAITSEIPEFAPARSAFSAEDLRWSTGRNTASFLKGIAEHRAPSDDEVSFRRLIGRRSAVRGFPLQPLVASFHIAYRELWSLMVEEAARVGGRAPMMLLSGGSTIWQWMHATTTAVADGYNEETARREAFATRTAAHFVETLSDDPSSDECRSLAAELGFAVDEAFRVFALIGDVAPVDTAQALAAALRVRGAVAVSSQRGRTAVVVAQGVESLDDAVASTDTPIGIGLERRGLEGARASLLEAERALDVALVRGGVCRFEDDWLPAIGLAFRGSLEQMLSDGVGVAASKPHLAEAVRTFAGSGFSVAEGARTLRVSQNSFRYRLTRWRALTGWDPWTHDGLTRSLMALAMPQRG